MALTYQIALINVWWRNGEQNNRYFSTLNEQITYFDSLIIGWSELVNFNLNDNISTTIYFRDKTNRPIEDLLKCNYAIIKNPNGNYRYFFVNRIWQDSATQVGVALELDDVQSNLLPTQDYLNNLFIKNFTNPSVYLNGTNYNYKISSDIIKPLNMHPAKRPKSSQESFCKFSNNATLNTWLNENVSHWCYVYLEANKLIYPRIDSNQYYNKTSSISENTFVKVNESTFPLDYGAVEQPIYKTNKRIYVKFNDGSNDRYIQIYRNGIESLFSIKGYIQGDSNLYVNGPIGTYGYCKKMSILPPFLKSITSSDFEIDGDGDLIFKGVYNSVNQVSVSINSYMCSVSKCMLDDPSTEGLTKATAHLGIFTGYDQQYSTIDIEFDNPINMSPSIYSANKHLMCSRLLGQEFRSFRLRIGSATFEYDPLKYLRNNSVSKINGEYTEVLTAGISKMYCRLKASNLYTTTMESDYNGVVASLDMILPTLTQEWSTFLANNKNYYMQKEFNQRFNFATDTFNASTNLLNGEAGVLNASTSMVNSIFKYQSNARNMAFRESDMQNSPMALANSTGDPYFMLEVSGFKPILDLLEAPEDYLISCADALENNGIPYEQECTFASLIGKHEAFEYLEGSIISFDYNFNLSQKEKDRLQLLFANGIRLFYGDDYNFNTTINLEVL